MPSVLPATNSHLLGKNHCPLFSARFDEYPRPVQASSCRWHKEGMGLNAGHGRVRQHEGLVGEVVAAACVRIRRRGVAERAIFNRWAQARRTSRFICCELKSTQTCGNPFSTATDCRSPHFASQGVIIRRSVYCKTAFSGLANKPKSAKPHACQTQTGYPALNLLNVVLLQYRFPAVLHPKSACQQASNSNAINSRHNHPRNRFCIASSVMQSPSLVCPSQYVDCGRARRNPIFTLQFSFTTANSLPRGAQLNWLRFLG